MQGTHIWQCDDLLVVFDRSACGAVLGWKREPHVAQDSRISRRWRSVLTMRLGRRAQSPGSYQKNQTDRCRLETSHTGLVGIVPLSADRHHERPEVSVGRRRLDEIAGVESH